MMPYDGCRGISWHASMVDTQNTNTILESLATLNHTVGIETLRLTDHIILSRIVHSLGETLQNHENRTLESTFLV